MHSFLQIGYGLVQSSSLGNDSDFLTFGNVMVLASVDMCFDIMLKLAVHLSHIFTMMRASVMRSKDSTIVPAGQAANVLDNQKY